MANQKRQRDPDLFQRVSEMAEHIGLVGKEKADYIHEHMTRGGYRAVPHYEPDDDDDTGDNPRFFSGRSGQSNRQGDRGDDRKTGSGWF
jgi:hypothetical protein